MSCMEAVQQQERETIHIEFLRKRESRGQAERYRSVNGRDKNPHAVQCIAVRQFLTATFPELRDHCPVPQTAIEFDGFHTYNQHCSNVSIKVLYCTVITLLYLLLSCSILARRPNFSLASSLQPLLKLCACSISCLRANHLASSSLQHPFGCKIGRPTVGMCVSRQHTQRCACRHAQSCGNPAIIF